VPTLCYLLPTPTGAAAAKASPSAAAETAETTTAAEAAAPVTASAATQHGTAQKSPKKQVPMATSACAGDQE
jgi:hypothetical protein